LEWAFHFSKHPTNNAWKIVLGKVPFDYTTKIGVMSSLVIKLKQKDDSKKENWKNAIKH
jgi:hypothetical protein